MGMNDECRLMFNVELRDNRHTRLCTLCEYGQCNTLYFLIKRATAKAWIQVNVAY